MKRNRVGPIALSLALLAGAVPGAVAADNEKIVVFGPSVWDQFAPGAPQEVTDEVTAALDAAFMELHPEVGEIVHDARGTVSDGLARLTNAQLAGEQIDVIMCASNPVNTSYASKGLIVPVDDLVDEVSPWLEDYAFEPFTIDGQIWGIPLSGVSTTLFVYNIDAFDAAGVGKIETFDEFVAAGPALKDAGYEPVTHQGRDPWMWPLWWMHALAQTTDGQQVEKTRSNLAGETKFTDAEDLAAMQMVRDFIDQGLMSESVLDLDGEQMRAEFIAGRAASYLGGTWDLPVLFANITDFDMGIFQFPKFTDQPGPRVGFGGVEVGLCLSPTSANPELAKEYIKFATSPEMAELTLTPLDPIATSHKAVPGSDNPIAVEIRENYLPSQLFLDWIWPRELAEVIQRQVQEVVGGSATPEEAVATIQAKYDSLVAEGYSFEG